MATVRPQPSSPRVTRDHPLLYLTVARPKEGHLLSMSDLRDNQGALIKRGDTVYVIVGARVGSSPRLTADSVTS